MMPPLPEGQFIHLFASPPGEIMACGESIRMDVIMWGSAWSTPNPREATCPACLSISEHTQDTDKA